jgi:hypothetical protein
VLALYLTLPVPTHCLIPALGVLDLLVEVLVHVRLKHPVDDVLGLDARHCARGDALEHVHEPPRAAERARGRGKERGVPARTLAGEVEQQGDVFADLSTQSVFALETRMG